jgi:hypothetical protein
MKNDNLKKALDEIGQDIVTGIVQELIRAGKKDTGNLINSIDYNVLETVDGVLLELNAPEYLKYIDEGRRPNSKQPPISAIIPWVRRKGIVVQGAKNERQSAFVIARAIGKNGIRPLNFLKPTIERVIKNKQELIRKMSEDDILSILNKILEE